MGSTGYGRSTSQHPVVGRDRELSELAGLALQTTAGQGQLILIEGESGIGKTLLLRTMLDAAADRFPRILWGTADEFDQRLPFATVQSCLGPLEVSHPQVADALALIRAGAAEYAVIESLTALIEEWCAGCPVALAVDDVHWADTASVLLLHRLGRVVGQLPLLVAATVRSGAGRPDVDALTRGWRGQGAAQLTLGPLPDPAVDELATDLAGGIPGPVLRGLISSAAGNPLYISELVGGLAREMRLRAAGEVVDVEPDPALRRMSPTLGMAIARRLAFLSGQARELLQVAALLGAEFSVADVAAVLDRPVTDLLGPVREATTAGLLTARADRLAFRHPLVRTALDDELPMSARQALHFQIAQTFTTRASPPRVAEHMLAAGPAAAPLLPWLAGAAEDLATRTPVLAAELLGQVLDTLTPPREVADLLRAGLAASLLRTGSARQAEQVARSALSVPSEPRTEAALRWTLANACASQGAINRTVEEIGVALATGRLTVAEQARFHGLGARSYITLSRAADAANAWQQSIAAAQASGDTMALAYGMQAASGAQTWDGWIDEALSSADASITATEALGARAGAQLAPHLQRGVCLAELDRDAEAEKAFEDALRLAERGAGTDFLAWLYNCVARLRFAQGRWDEALAEIQAGLDLPDPFDMGRHLRGVAALIAVHRRDRATLASLLPFLEAPMRALSPGRQSAHAPAWALALAAQAEGRTAEAAAILSPMWAEDIDRDHLRYLRHYLVPDLVAFTLAAGGSAAAQQIGHSIGSYASNRSAPALGRSARHAQALANRDAAGLIQVADEYQRASRPLFAAQAREQAAPLLAEAGMVPQVRNAIAGAVAGYEAMEAHWDVARAETLLRTFGFHRGVRGPRRRPKSGWDSLTEAERVVADLVAEGLSNPAVAARLYLSRRTVQGHVSSILSKLGVTSRVELATMVMRHQATRV